MVLSKPVQFAVDWLYHNALPTGGFCGIVKSYATWFRDFNDKTIRTDSDVLVLVPLDGNMLASGSRNGKVHIWDPNAGVCFVENAASIECVVQCNGQINCVIYRKKSKQICTWCEKQIT